MTCVEATPQLRTKVKNNRVLGLGCMRIGLHRRSETIAKRGKKNDCCDRAGDRLANIQNGSREAPMKGEIKEAERYCKEYSGDIGREIEPPRPSPKIKQAS
jgi:hypothetical protein